MTMEHAAETFIPKYHEEDIIIDDSITALVLNEMRRWSEHCGHYPITEGIDRYAKMLGLDRLVVP